MMQPLFASYIDLLEDLTAKFAATFDGLPAEALDWVPGDEMNSLCVLVVHTCGSARFWIGDVALGEPSNRDRASEFTARGLTHADLNARFAAMLDYARGALERVSPDDFGTLRAPQGRPAPVTVAWALLHTLEHVALHLGHAQITRQLWEKHSAK